MKIVILAAGIGSRLGNPFPKPLTTLANNKSIMELQTEHLSATFNLYDIHVVVGFKKDLIMERFPDLIYIYNPFFDQTNTAKSLLRALKRMQGEDVLWLNGDVVFNQDLLLVMKPYIDKKQSFVAVNTEKVGEEEVKYTLRDGFIDQLSKKVNPALGEAVGINFIAATDLDALVRRLETCTDEDYFEKGLEMAITLDDMKIIALDISGHDCMEIDFKEDLEDANSMIRK